MLSRGLLGDQGDKPKVACPVHKKTFALETGKGLSDKDFSIQTFPVKVDGDDVHLLLPSVETLDEIFATDKTCNGTCHTTPDAATTAPRKLPTRKAKVDDPFAVGPLE